MVSKKIVKQILILKQKNVGDVFIEVYDASHNLRTSAEKLVQVLLTRSIKIPNNNQDFFATKNQGILTERKKSILRGVELFDPFSIFNLFSNFPTKVPCPNSN